jgi:hypothetical protein
MSEFDAHLAKSPPMSRRQERQLKQEWRKQIKPKSIAMKEQARNFFTVVGLGITQWSRMEERLVQVASRLLKTSQVKAGLVMYSIINFNAWLDIIEGLFVLDGTYPQSLKKWRRICQALRGIKDTRDRLAHHALSQIEWYSPTGEEGVQAYLRPSKFDTRNKAKKMKPLTITEILDFTGKVEDVHNVLILLLEQMKKPKSSR